MTPQLAVIKLRLRLNKLHSQDYDNIEDWKSVEAINKAQIEWFRKQVEGYNRIQAGDETVSVKVDDLQQFLVEDKIGGINKDHYFECTLPSNYLYHKRILPMCIKGKCEVPVESMFIEEANVNSYLFDWNLKPSFEWRETFHTLIGNTMRVYKDDTFQVLVAYLTYYRKPQKMDIAGYVHESGVASTNVNIEFKDDVVEIILDEAASILASDTEYFTQLQALKQRADGNS